MPYLATVALAILLLSAAGCASAAPGELVAQLPAEPTPVSVELTPADLYMGLEAHRATLNGNAIVLDTRNWAAAKQPGEMPGRIVTDVIDLGSGAVVSLPVKISGLTVSTDVALPQRPAVQAADLAARVDTFLRHGPTFFQAAGWSDWREVGAGKTLDIGSDAYLQLRIDLVSESPTLVPGVKGVAIKYTRQATNVFQPAVAVKDVKVQKIVRSTIQFGYERMDQKDLAWLRKSCNLDKVIAGKKTEMDKLIALNDWASRRTDVRGAEGTAHLGSDDPYPWNIHKIFSLDNGGTVYGHCASYSQLLITAACSLGWHARHVNIEGYRTCTHEIAEIWVNELGKWVYFDPSLGTYYTDRKGNPLGLLEMHEIFTGFFVERGKTLKSYLPRVDKPESDDPAWQRRHSLDMDKFPAVCKTNDITYGENKVWDWTEGQGIMTAGFMQLTPRNNFNSQPAPAFTRYAYSPEGVNGFPYFADEKTPLWYDQAVEKQAPDGWTRNWFTRHRDWNWTLNQAAMRLVRTGPKEIAVELGNSQPFFKKYVATLNGRAVDVTSPLTWKLDPGRNTLVVDCVDEFGQRSLPSSVTVELKE